MRVTIPVQGDEISRVMNHQAAVVLANNGRGEGRPPPGMFPVEICRQGGR